MGDDELDGWTDRTRDIDRDIDEGWGVVRQARESALLNPRRHAAERAHAASGFEPVLGPPGAGQRRDPLDGPHDPHRGDGAGHAGTCGSSRPGWRFVGRAGAAMRDADAGAMAAVRGDLEGLGHELAGELMATRRWPVYGALLVNLRNIVEAMGAVADAQPVRPAHRPGLSRSAVAPRAERHRALAADRLGQVDDELRVRAAALARRAARERDA